MSANPLPPLPANVGLAELCQTLLPRSICPPWQRKIVRYICRHLSTEALSKASSFGVKLDVDVGSLLSSLRRIFATSKPPVGAYRQFSSRLQLSGESARDHLGCLRPLVFAAFPNCPPSVTDTILVAYFRAGILDDHLRRKLIKGQSLASDEILSLVQDYEDRYGPSLTSPFQRSEASSMATRSVATQTYRNLTRTPRGRQASVAQISSESLPVPSVSSNSDFAAPIVDVLVADTRVTFIVGTGAACSLLNPMGFSHSWLRKAEVSHRRPRIVAANGMPFFLLVFNRRTSPS
ncbi:unnamed protein product [Dibothriocephalus latus]|uniref:Uncharacterized protein n=1 Tax=Dibothriocephalus latus TaxID=60516 RepID=A0A3P7PR46_DIBLA|nr:unnamed protein product [Dibothriocephalus latus]